MSAIIERVAPGATDTLRRILDTSFPLGRQFGKPVEVTLREALRQAPCFLTMAGIIGVAVFLV